VINSRKMSWMGHVACT